MSFQCVRDWDGKHNEPDDTRAIVVHLVSD
jgi:hypothetical protein